MLCCVSQDSVALVLCCNIHCVMLCCSSQDSVALVLDAIKSAVRFQKTLSEAWLKVIFSFRTFL